MGGKNGCWAWIVLAMVALGGVRLLGADATQPASDGAYKEVPVYRFVDAVKQQGVMSRAFGRGAGMGEGVPTYVIRAAPVGTTSIQTFLLPQRLNGGTLFDSVKDFQKGDYIALTSEEMFNSQFVTNITKYDLKPGEQLPNIFILKGMDDGDNGAEKLHLYKLGASGEALVPANKPDLLAVAARLKAGDSIEVDGHISGKVLQVTDLWLYCAPIQGTIAEVGKEEVKGGVTTGVKVTLKDESEKTLLVPGKVNGKGVFVPQEDLAGKLKHFKAGATVKATCRSDGEKIWIKTIEIVPKDAGE